jgi:hypothetical protein
VAIHPRVRLTDKNGSRGSAEAGAGWRAYVRRDDGERAATQAAVEERLKVGLQQRPPERCLVRYTPTRARAGREAQPQRPLRAVLGQRLLHDGVAPPRHRHLPDRLQHQPRHERRVARRLRAGVDGQHLHLPCHHLHELQPQRPLVTNASTTACSGRISHPPHTQAYAEADPRCIIIYLLGAASTNGYGARVPSVPYFVLEGDLYLPERRGGGSSVRRGGGGGLAQPLAEVADQPRHLPPTQHPLRTRRTHADIIAPTPRRLDQLHPLALGRPPHRIIAPG